MSSVERFAPLLGFEAEAARRRGWWLGRIEQLAPAEWRLTFCFPLAPSRTVTLRRAELSFEDVTGVAEGLLAGRRRSPGERRRSGPSSGGSPAAP